MTGRKRKHVPLKVKLAAALLALGHIDYEESKTMTADQIIRRYDFDHWPILHALGGKDAPWNLRPMLRPDHREKSRKDTAAVAKVKRIIRKEQARPALYSPARAPNGTGRPKTPAKRKIASRGFSGASRPMAKRDRRWRPIAPRDINEDMR